MLRFVQDDIHDIVGYKNVTRKARVYPLSTFSTSSTLHTPPTHSTLTTPHSLKNICRVMPLSARVTKMQPANKHCVIPRGASTMVWDVVYSQCPDVGIYRCFKGG